MQKINRIHVARFGTATAWYDQTSLDFTDKDSYEAVNAIVNLENTGGKTSLLSYIFSIFEPRRGHFIQHMQNPNHQMNDYFAKDGKPSFIIIEWQMPSRSAGGLDYKLVTGQGVVARDDIERGKDLERVFFAFEAQHGIVYEDVPAPGLSMAEGVLTQNELNLWLTQMSRKSPDDFFYTRQQADWVTHLSTTRLLDLDLLAMQRQFNGQEGGLESGFLAFTDEEDLIRKIMSLTMDTQRAHDVRASVANVTDTHQMKPKLELRLAQLGKLRAAFEPLGVSAKTYQVAISERSNLLKRAAGLAAAMGKARIDEQERVTFASELISSLSPFITQNKDLLIKHRDTLLSLLGLQHAREVDQLEAEHKEVLASRDATAAQLNLVEGAISYKKIMSARQDIKREEASLDEDTEDLRPLKEKLERHGAILRGAIDLLMQEITAKRAGLSTIEQQAIEAIKQAKLEIKVIADAMRDFNKESSGLTSAIDLAEMERNLLLDERVLDPFDQDAGAAIQRIDADIQEKNTHLTDLQVQRTHYQQQIKELIEQAGGHALLANTKEHERTSLSAKISKCRDKRESLEQNPRLCSLVDSELCDPDSLILPGTLAEFMASRDRDVLECDIYLNQLNQSRKSIQETGLAGQNDNVDKVVQALKAAGIHSARATNAYIADLVPNASEARGLVTSDPARFLGVKVDMAEWERARFLLAQTPVKLSAPVTVARATLDSTTTQSDRMVVPAEEDDAYNKDAASSTLEVFAHRIAETNDNRERFFKQLKEAREVSTKLLDYQERFGATVLAQLQKAVQACLDEEDALNALKDECALKAEVLHDKDRDLEAQIGGLPALLATLDSNVKRLKAYSIRHEQPLAERKARLVEVTAALKAYAEQEAELTVVIEDNDNEVSRCRSEQSELNNGANDLTHRKGVTQIFDATYDVITDLKAGFELESLVRTYESDKDIYAISENERLGARRIKLQALRASEAEKVKEYGSDFSHLRDDDVIALVGADLKSDRLTLKSKVEGCAEAINAASNKLAVARAHSDSFFTENKPADPSDDDEILSDDELTSRIDELGQDVRQLDAETERFQKDVDEAQTTLVKNKAKVAALVKNTTTLSSAIDHAATAAPPILLEGNGDKQLDELFLWNKSLSKSVDVARKAAQGHFEAFRAVAGSPSVQELNPAFSSELMGNSFDSTCNDYEDLMMQIDERIQASQSELDGLLPNFENCVGEVHQLVEEGMRVLKKACEVKVPEGAPYVGGKAIMKMRYPVTGVTTEASREAIRHYLNTLIVTKIIPETGADMVAAGIINLSLRKTYGIQLLQMEQNTDHQYQDAGKLKKSGGQGVVIAMFMYLMLSQLRRTHQAVTKRGGGCPLILDNPFAKVQTRALIDVQIMLAEAIGVQLIFLTAMKDINILAGFSKVIRLRKVGMKNNKSYIQAATATFYTSIQRTGYDE